MAHFFIVAFYPKGTLHVSLLKMMISLSYNIILVLFFIMNSDFEKLKRCSYMTGYIGI